MTDEKEQSAMCGEAGAAALAALVVHLMAEAEAAGARYPAALNIWGEARPAQASGLGLSGAARNAREGAE